MRLVYLGTPEAAVPPLRALVADGHEVRMVVTRADKRRGRGGAVRPSPVKEAAIDLGLPVTSSLDDVVSAGAELGVVVAFGRIIPGSLLADVPMVNLHFSLLPRWRGAAPVERAILAGDEETGVCLMELDEGLDTGPVFDCRTIAVDPNEMADELRGRLVMAGTELLLARIREGLGIPTPQRGQPTYATKIDSAELEIDWTRAADEVHRLIRLGRSWTQFRGRRLRILRARLVPESRLAPGELNGLVVGPGIELIDVQPEGKQPQPASAWINGARPQLGEMLGR